MLYLSVLGSSFEKLMSHLKTVPSNLLYCKVWHKNKTPYIWGKKCLIWVLLGWNLKMLLSYLKCAALNLSSCNILCKNKTV